MIYFISFAIFYIIIQILIEYLLMKNYSFFVKYVGEYDALDAKYLSWGWIFLFPLAIVLVLINNSYIGLRKYVLKGFKK